MGLTTQKASRITKNKSSIIKGGKDKSSPKLKRKGWRNKIIERKEPTPNGVPLRGKTEVEE